MTADIPALFLHFLSLSILATGGAIALASDMHRYVVEEHHYISHTDFANSIVIAQAAPGPNTLFVTVIGWYIAGLPGALATTLGLSLPALILPFVPSRLGRRPAFEHVLDVLQRGLGPLAIGMMFATCWVLLRQAPGGWVSGAIVAVTVLALTSSRVKPVLLILAAGALGALLDW